MSVSDSLPIRWPSLAFGIVVTLSTMTRLGVLNPLALSGSSGIRSSGASTVSVVNGQTVTDAVLSKASS
jgi:hypothetical protein